MRLFLLALGLMLIGVWLIILLFSTGRIENQLVADVHAGFDIPSFKTFVAICRHPGRPDLRCTFTWHHGNLRNFFFYYIVTRQSGE